MKGRHFDDIDDITSNTAAALKAIPQNQFQNCFEGWTRRSYRCIASQGEYFEGDHGAFSNEVCSTFTAISSRTLWQDYIYHIVLLCMCVWGWGVWNCRYEFCDFS